jgi:hypothetical protein
MDQEVSLLMLAKLRRAEEARNVDRLKVCSCSALCFFHAFSCSPVILCFSLFLCLQIFDHVGVGVLAQQSANGRRVSSTTRWMGQRCVGRFVSVLFLFVDCVVILLSHSLFLYVRVLSVAFLCVLYATPQETSAELAASLSRNTAQAEELRNMINGVESVLAVIPGSIKTPSQLRQKQATNAERLQAENATVTERKGRGRQKERGRGRRRN